MKKIILSFGVFFYVVIFTNCTKDKVENTNNTSSVYIDVSSNNIKVMDKFSVSIVINNIDSLFGLSFDLNYDTSFFLVDSNSLSSRLFIQPFPEEIPTIYNEGILSAAFGELDNIRRNLSGTACSITFSSQKVGTSKVYLSSLDMIKSDGSAVSGYPFIVEPIEITIID